MYYPMNEPRDAKYISPGCLVDRYVKVPEISGRSPRLSIGAHNGRPVCRVPPKLLGSWFLIATPGDMGPIDRQMHLIEAEPLSISLAGGEQAALQHLVGAGTDARHEVLGIEGRLFYFS
jgi:hypothetical protein